MKKAIILIMFLIPVLGISAQTSQVTGTVTDENDVGIPGATVLIKGTSTGAITDIDGNYTINASSDDVLVFSFVGFLSQEVTVGNQSSIDVQLKETAYDMDEVVVIGYGSAAVKDLTGNIAVVNNDELTRQTTPNVGQALQGKISGIQVTNSGQPGSSPTIRIRGLGTVISGASPLYVVDGAFTQNIGYIAPEQIESVTVLKDASSAAIYGVRAANGVIIITTKSGETGQPQFNYSGYTGVQQVSNLLDMANADQYIQLVNEKIAAGERRGNASTPFDPDAYNDNTDWFDNILRPALIQNHYIEMKGGNNHANYYYGIGISDQEGIIRGNNYTRVNLRGSSDIRVNKILKAGFGITINGINSDNPANVLRQAYVAPPAFEPRNDAGDFTDPVILGFGNFANPAATIFYHNNRTQSINTLTNIYAELTPIEGLKIKSSFSLDGSYSRNRAYSPEYWVSVTQNDTISHLTKSNSEQLDYTFDNTATYTRNFGPHRFNVMAGYSMIQIRNRGMSATTTRVPYFSEATLYLNNGSIDDITAGDYGSLIRSTSYFGRLFYAYENKYLLTLTMRFDGSSTFPAEERWGYFPSIGIGWLASDEDFIKDLGIFDFLKIKASWGKLGNNQVPPNAYTLTLNNADLYSVVYGPFGSTNISQGGSVTSLVEPLLRWEVLEEYDIGFESLTMDYRLSADFGFYRRITKSAIFPVPVVGTAGTSGSSYYDNNADILNQGVELTIGWKDNPSNRFSYNIGGNISYNNNKVLELEPGTLPFYAGGAYNGELATYTQLDHPVGEFYVLEVDGIFQDQTEVANYKSSDGTIIMPDAVAGDFRYIDHNDDGVIDELDRIPYGSYTPKMLYALNLRINFGQIDFSVDFQGVAGNKIYNLKRVGRFGNENYDADFANKRWYEPGSSDTYPSADVGGGMNAKPNTFFVESGSYFRIRNLQIGYNLPARVLSRINSNGIRIYASAQNLFTMFQYNGFSPEIPGGSPTTAGMDDGVYPLSRIISFGANIKF